MPCCYLYPDVDKHKLKNMRVLLLLILALSSQFNQAQIYDFYEINFDIQSELFRIRIDSISNPNNQWQIGVPDKSIISSAFSDPNVIITNTNDPYSISDTSSFIIEHVAEAGFQTGYAVDIAGKYFVDADSLNDIGFFEISPDNGDTWIDLINDTIYEGELYYWWNGKPTFTGSSIGWQEFWVDLSPFGQEFNIEYGDTILYKFTFISDSIQTNRDGLAFDDLEFFDYISSIEEPSSEFFSVVSPNPSSEQIRISFLNSGSDRIDCRIFDQKGKSVLYIGPTKSTFIDLNLSRFKDGLYFYRLENLETYELSSGKILKK